MRNRLFISSLVVLSSILIILFVPAMAFAGGASGAPHDTGDTKDCRACHRPAAHVEFFSPQGTTKGVRQASARFSEQMVSFGNPTLADPFDINCSGIGNIAGKGRWADGKNWEYDFDKDLPAGIKCDFTLKPWLKDISGVEVAGQKIFSFSTGGPAVIRQDPWGGLVSEDQAFILFTDSQPDEQSVLSNVYFRIEDISEPVGVEIIKGAQRDELLKAVRYKLYQKEFPFVIVIRCNRNFPNDKEVKLVWGKGVMSASGVATTQDQVLNYKSRPAFTANLKCSRENENSLCIPLLPIEVRFTGPIPAQKAKQIILTGGGKTYKPQLSYEYNKEEYASSVRFYGPFPERQQFRIELPPDLKDDAGRELANKEKFPLTFFTGPYPSLAKFAADFGIIETSSPYLPVTVRNIEAEIKGLMLDMEPENGGPKKQDSGGIFNSPAAVENTSAMIFSGDIKSAIKGRVVSLGTEGDVLKYFFKQKKIQQENEAAYWLKKPPVSVLKGDPRARQFEMPKPNEEKAFEVIGIPLGKPGFYVVEIESLLLGKSLTGKPGPMYVSSAALVTDLSVHFKWGRESSLVWVTGLEDANPVAGAKVSVMDCKGKVYWRGETGKDGTALLGKELPKENILPRCSEGGSGQLFVFAKTKGDMSFVSSAWSEGIEPWRFQLPAGEDWDYTPIAVHTIFDRPLFRAGETVHMKHVIRKRTGGGFTIPKNGLPESARIEHCGSGQAYTIPLQWDAANGIAESTWQIPKDAKLGCYRVQFYEGKKNTGRVYESGSFNVQEYKVPLMKASIQPVTDPIVNKKETDVDVQVSYLSGGSAQGLPVKLRYQVGPGGGAWFEDYKGFRFDSGHVKEGIFREENEEYGYAGGRQRTPENPKTVSLDLGAGGSARVHLAGLPIGTYPQQLQAELEYKDPNGIIQTVSRSIDLWPSHIVIGIGPKSWQARNRSAAGFRLLAVDLKGKPVAGVRVSADVYQRKFYSHRKRLVGGFYSYEYVTEVKKTGPICDGITNSAGYIDCEKPAPAEGNLIIQAKAVDDEGNLSEANSDIWVSGKDGLWFKTEDSDRIDVIPEQKQYEPGQKARFQVRMPFREATALVTVEREGVLDKYVVPLSAKDPEIEIPVKKNYAPNVFVSVLVVRGRVGEAQPTAMVDLGKPAYKLGIGYIDVGWRENTLDVKVSADRQVYKVRQKAKVTINVTRPDGGPARGAEVAVAAVDQGLLELMPNESWKLLENMMGQRPYEVRTSTAQMQVVGKRHFGLKALPSGGGGGRMPTRELFGTLLLWKGRVKLDDNGAATLDVPINDSLTSFKIVAVATSGASLFGTGQTSIRTSQDLMLLSGLPEMVREGDKFRAVFTVRNASDRPMEVGVSGRYGTGKQPVKNLPGLTEKLAPGEAREASWFITAPLAGETLNWVVAAAEANGTAKDSISVKQKVATAVPARVVQATILQIDKSYGMKVEKPLEAIAGRGGINVTLAPSITGGLEGVKRYMLQYPYTCMEQRVSIAIALKSDALWKTVVNDLPSYLDSDGFVKYFPSMYEGSVSLTAYVLSISNEAGREIPANIKQKMEQALAGFMNGYLRRYSPVSYPDLTFLKLSAAEALSRDGRLEPRMLDPITIEPNLWPTSAVIDWFNILSRVTNIPGRENRLDEAERIIRSRLNFQGTVMTFSTEQQDFLWWLMVSGDSNALRTILAFMDSGKWQEDMPRLVRGAVARQHQGHWLTTTANAWGVVALDKFAEKFERVAVSGLTEASLSAGHKTLNWAKQPNGGTLSLGWPKGQGAKNLALAHKGQGKPWATIQSLAAIPLKAPLSTGFKVKKTLTPVVQKVKGKWSAGDVIRIRLDLETQSDMTWVAVSDPVPAGASILGTGLGRDSQLLTGGERWTGYVWPAFEERAFGAYRAYFEYVPKGEWSIEYTIRLNNEGVFQMPETRVEALYSPEMFGEIPNKQFRIWP